MSVCTPPKLRVEAWSGILARFLPVLAVVVDGVEPSSIGYKPIALTIELYHHELNTRIPLI
jgi:hypothetical protein